MTKAVEAAELMSGHEVKDCFVGVAGANVEGINSRGVVAVTGKGREICQADVDRVIEAARAIVIPMDREVLHVIPQTFIVDDQKGIRDPIDMIGVRLEAEVHIITGSVTTAQNLVRCVNRAGFKADGLILQSLAASRAVLTQDERELGCLLVDLGGGTTDVLMFSEGAPYFSASVGAGGAQVTNDLSIVLNVPMEGAERIKRESGSCYLPHVEAGESIVVPGVGGSSAAGNIEGQGSGRHPAEDGRDLQAGPRKSRATGLLAAHQGRRRAHRRRSAHARSSRPGLGGIRVACTDRSAFVARGPRRRLPQSVVLDGGRPGVAWSGTARRRRVERASLRQGRGRVQVEKRRRVRLPSRNEGRFGQRREGEGAKNEVGGGFDAQAPG